MSYVTNIILKVAIHENAVRGFNKELDNLTGYQLIRVDEQAGGDKVMEIDVHMAAINGVDQKELRQLFFSTPWSQPEKVQLLVQEHEEDLLKVYWIDEPKRFVLTECI